MLEEIAQHSKPKLISANVPRALSIEFLYLQTPPLAALNASPRSAAHRELGDLTLSLCYNPNNRKPQIQAFNTPRLNPLPTCKLNKFRYTLHPARTCRKLNDFGSD